MNIVIADHEDFAREQLRVMLRSEPGVRILAECIDGREILSVLSTVKPEVLLVDTQIPNLDGFAVGVRFPPRQTPVVIFTTANDHLATWTFETHALDCLRKPFVPERLHEAINRARAELLISGDREAVQRLLELSETAAQRAATNRRLAVRVGGRVLILGFDEIDWVGAAGNYVKVNVAKQSYLYRQSIGKIAERLDPAQFIRIHRSAIVNVDKIRELHPVNNGEYIVVLKNGKGLSCSRGYRSGLQQLIG